MNLMRELYKKMINDGILPSEIACASFTEGFLEYIVGIDDEAAMVEALVKLAIEDMETVIAEEVETPKYISTIKSFMIDGRMVGRLIKSAMVDKITENVEDTIELFVRGVGGSNCSDKTTITVPMSFGESVELFGDLGLRGVKDILISNCDLHQFVFHYNDEDELMGLTVLTIYKLMNDGSCLIL